jgi:hypothetical protein
MLQSVLPLDGKSVEAERPSRPRTPAFVTGGVANLSALL